jgi:tRNA A37 threonylcarbamoyladenosine dehydratase
MTERQSEIRFSRTAQLIGTDGLATLRRARIAVVGVGGVGSYVVEALARAGVGWLVLIDHDQSELSNTNRQLHALEGHYGQPKVELMAERVKAINPDSIVVTRQTFVRNDNLASVFQGNLSYIVDAIDTVASKVAVIRHAIEREIPIISAMGAGNKLDPLAIKVAEISKSHTCPLAKAVRKGLRECGITEGAKAVFSTEPPVTPHTVQSMTTAPVTGCASCSKGMADSEGCCPRQRSILGTISYMPAAMGLIVAAEVIRDLLAIKKA